jgi:hypothetical protein
MNYIRSLFYGTCLCVFSFCISEVTYGFVGLLVCCYVVLSLIRCVAVLNVFVGPEASH